MGLPQFDEFFDLMNLEYDIYRRVLNEIGKAINQTIEESTYGYGLDYESCEFLNDEDDEDALCVRHAIDDRFYNEGILIIEQLLGTTFVFYQTYITSIISKFLFYKYQVEQELEINLELPSFKNQKNVILQIGQIPPKFTYKEGDKEEHYSAIQVIDGFANYFKHHEEWNYDWKNLNQSAEKTVNIIKSVEGVNFDNNDNMIKASRALGNTTLTNTVILFEKLEKWYIAVGRTWNQEISIYK